MNSRTSNRCGDRFAARGLASRHVAAWLFGAALLFLAFPGLVSAEPIMANLQPVDDLSNVLSDSNYYTIAYIQARGGIIIGDKLFDYFSVVATAQGGAPAPDAAAISITPVQINGDYGMKFNGGWSASAGQIVNSTIQFHASILPEYSGYLFEDNSLYMTGYGNSAPNGLVSISENVYASYPGLPGSEPLANKFVYYQNASVKHVLDTAEFAPIDELWVVKDVSVNGGSAGFPGAAHLSEFYQTFSQVVPEPSTFVLLAIGLIFPAMYAWRKRARNPR
jgi:hypothetical protein